MAWSLSTLALLLGMSWTWALDHRQHPCIMARLRSFVTAHVGSSWAGYTRQILLWGYPIVMLFVFLFCGFRIRTGQRYILNSPEQGVETTFCDTKGMIFKAMKWVSGFVANLYLGDTLV